MPGLEKVEFDETTSFALSEMPLSRTEMNVPLLGETVLVRCLSNLRKIKTGTGVLVVGGYNKENDSRDISLASGNSLQFLDNLYENAPVLAEPVDTIELRYDPHRSKWSTLIALHDQNPNPYDSLRYIADAIAEEATKQYY